MMKKKLIIAFITVILSVNSIVTSAQEIFYKEFSDDNSLSQISVNTTGGNVTVEKTDKETYMSLTDTDSDSNSGIVAVKNFTSGKNFVAFEIKFKLSGEIPVTEFSINANSGKCFYAKLYSTGMINVSDGNKEVSTIETKIVPDKWYTIRMVADKSTQKGELKISSNELKGYKGKSNKSGKLEQLTGEYTICDLDFLNSYNGKNFDTIRISTSAGKGSIHIGYIKIEEGNNLTMKEPPAEAPRVKDPKPHPVKGQININYNGEYMYFAIKPIMVNDRVMLPVRNIFEMLGMKVEWIEEKSTAVAKKEGLEISLTLGSNNAIVNGKTIQTDVAPILKKDRIFMPVRFIGENAGLDVSWDENIQTVIMKEKE